MTDTNGVKKPRPVIVLTPSAEINRLHAFHGMAISTTFPNPLPNDCVALPSGAEGKSPTGLRRPCVAVIRWIQNIHPGDVTEYRGDVPTELMEQILERLWLLRDMPRQS
jgi:mRNA-degrading endonuclease toxin of MazEF toxin-antitoxin module